jgi:hypothetical protein
MAAKFLAGECKRIDIKKLKEWGYLEEGSRTGCLAWENNRIPIEVFIMEDFGFMRLAYDYSPSAAMFVPPGQIQHHDYKILIVSTRPRFGGYRYWMICPECKKRIGVLYLPPGEHRFLCRHCYNLRYESQMEYEPVDSGESFQKLMKYLEKQGISID